MTEKVFYREFSKVNVGEFFLLLNDEKGYIKINTNEAVEASTLATGIATQTDIKDLAIEIGSKVRTYRWKF